MHKRFTALLLLVLLLALAGCASQPAVVATPKGLTWTGSALEGARFYEREFPRFTVHYALPTLPDEAELVATVVNQILTDLETEGRGRAAQRLHVWMLPPGYNWPEGAGTATSIRSLAPYQVVVRTMTTSGPNQPGPSWYRPFVLLAISQGAGSPVFTSDWLQTGMGAVLSQGPEQFLQLVSAPGGLPGDPVAALANRDNPQAYYQAAVVLSALLVDRWGTGWPALWEGDELTPLAALQWITGMEDQAKAVAALRSRSQWVNNQVWRYNGAYVGMLSLADMSPIRVVPHLTELPKGPGPMANYSPQRYEINASYDRAARTITGDMTLTWQNGEGIPLETLHFNLWSNSEQSLAWGGGMTVQKVQVAGQAVPYVARGLDLVVPLGRPVQPGEEIAVQIAFQTRIGGLGSRLSGQNAIGRLQLVDWYPSLAVLDDRGWQLGTYPMNVGEPSAEHADFQIRLAVPKGTTLGGTGSLVRREEQGERWVYVYDAPHVTGWAALGGTDMLQETRTVGGVTVRAIDHDGAWVRTVMDRTAQVLPMLSGQLGPYPFKELVVAKGTPVLTQPGIIVAMDTFNDRWVLPLYNGLGHQWFGLGVGNDQWGEPWLDESFARYVERRLARATGAEVYVTDLKTRAASLTPKATGSLTALLRHAQYNGALLEKGPWVLEELEAKLGTAGMNRLLAQWNARYRHRTATTEEFIALVEELTGQAWRGWFTERGIDPADRVTYQPLFPLGKFTLP